MPVCYMLIGPPGSGKSTWVAKTREAAEHYVWLSTDNFIEAMALAEGKTYSDVFKQYVDAANKTMEAHLQTAVKNGQNIIWDQTNMAIKGRRGKLAKLKGYDVIAVTFELDRTVIDERNAKRRAETGKYIAPHIVDDMIRRYEAPTIDEGFTGIITVTE